MNEFLHMDGYAFFVWGSYAGMALVFIWNMMSARARHHELTRRARDAHDGDGT